MKIITLILILLTFFVACTTNEKPLNSFSTLNLRNDSLDLKEEILTNKSASLSLASGNSLEIPNGSFLYEDGSPVTEPINITIKEYSNYASILSEGLQTISTKGLLESEGMYYIEAKAASGKIVKINTDNPLLLSGTLNTSKEDFQLYQGISSDSGIIWNNPVPSYKLGPINFNTIYHYYLTDIIKRTTPDIYKFCYKSILNFMKDSLNLVEYQNSIVASPAFIERYFRAIYVYASSLITNNEIRNYYETKWKWNAPSEESWATISNSIGNYIKSLPLKKLTLQEFDSLMLKKFKADSLFAINYYQKEKGDLNKETPHKIHLAINSYKENICQNSRYNYFDFTQSINIDTTSLNDISKNGYDPDNTEIQLLLAIKNKDIFYQSYKCTHGFSIRSNVFKYPLPKLGWYNIDRLIQTGLEDVYLEVKINTENPNTTVALLLADRKVVIYGKVIDNKCIFNRKLPKEDAIIVATTSVDEKIYFAKKDVLLGQETVLDLPLKLSTQDKIQEELENINKK